MCLNNSEFFKYRLLCFHWQFKTHFSFWYSEYLPQQQLACLKEFSELTAETDALKGP